MMTFTTDEYGFLAFWQLAIIIIFLVIAVLDIVAFISIVRNKQLTPFQKLVWTAATYFLPFFGALLYLFNRWSSHWANNRARKPV